MASLYHNHGPCQSFGVQTELFFDHLHNFQYNDIAAGRIYTQADMDARMIAHKTSILAAETARLAGGPTYTAEEVEERIEALFHAAE